MNEFEAQKNNEVKEFRTRMRSFCEEKAQQRQMLPWQRWMEYNFPCQLEPCCSLPSCWAAAKSKATKKIFINIKFEASDVSLSAVVAFVYQRLFRQMKGDLSTISPGEHGVKQVCGGGSEVSVTGAGENPLPHCSRFLKRS